MSESDLRKLGKTAALPDTTSCYGGSHTGFSTRDLFTRPKHTSGAAGHSTPPGTAWNSASLADNKRFNSPEPRQTPPKRHGFCLSEQSTLEPRSLKPDSVQGLAAAEDTQHSCRSTQDQLSAWYPDRPSGHSAVLRQDDFYDDSPGLLDQLAALEVNSGRAAAGGASQQDCSPFSLSSLSLQPQKQQLQPPQTHTPTAAMQTRPKVVLTPPTAGSQPSAQAAQQHLHPGSQPGPAPPAQAPAFTTFSRPKLPPLQLSLKEWDLPAGVVQAYAEAGVKQMYPWQAAALQCGYTGSNLVYVAPTSGGKSLVSEVLLIRRLIASQHYHPVRKHIKVFKRALVILPYISIVAERTCSLQRTLQPVAGGKVQGYFSSGENGTPLSPWQEAVAVCTIEKANVTINRLIQEGRLGELTCVVVDELHMVGDEGRGLALETMLTKLLFHPHAQGVQIIGMSATAGGLETLATWLRARLFLTNFRPVPLKEHAVFGSTIFELDMSKARDGEVVPPLKPLRELVKGAKDDRDGLIPLIAEAAAQSQPVLVFCATRAQCQSCAKLAAEMLPAQLGPDFEIGEEERQVRSLLVAEMQEATGGLCSPGMEALLAAGVAYHHAGLTSQERNVIESGYRRGALNVLMATSTLAAGINLPAKRVILRSLWQGIGPVSREQYFQMVGRAGRAGHADCGEAFLIGRGQPWSNTGEWGPICQLIVKPMPVLCSKILPSLITSSTSHVDESAFDDSATRHLQKILLEGVANRSISDAKIDIDRLVRSTLLSQQVDYKLVHCGTVSALQHLRRKQLLSLKAPSTPQEAPRWEATPMGRAVYACTLPIDAGLALYRRLQCTIEAGLPLGATVHEGYIPLTFLIIQEVPFSIFSWQHWDALFRTFSASVRRMAHALGVTEAYITSQCSGRRSHAHAGERHARLAAACAVELLLREKPARQVADVYGHPDTITKAGLSQGQLQKLQADVAKWAGLAALMANAAGWCQLEECLLRLSQQAEAGAHPHLLPLMQVHEVTAARARALSAAGMATPEDITHASEEQIVRALASGLPRSMRTASHGPAKALAVGATGNPATNALVRRTAQLVLAGAHEHVLQVAHDQQERAEQLLADTQRMDIASSEASSSDEEHDSMHDMQPPAISRRLQTAMTHTAAAGYAEVLSYGADSDVDILQAALEDMLLQPRVAIAFTEQHADKTASTSSMSLPQGVALCWNAATGSIVHLSLTQPAAARPASQLITQAVQQLLGDDSITKVMYRAWQVLPGVLRYGWQLRGKLEDLGVAAWLLWPDKDLSKAAAAAQAAIMPRFRRKVRPQSSAAASEACTAALMACACLEAARSLLRSRSMLQVYEEQEIPAVQLLASAIATGLPVDTAAVHQSAQQAQHAVHTSQHKLSHLAGAAVDASDVQSCVLTMRRLGLPLPSSQPTTQDQLLSLLGSSAKVQADAQSRVAHEARLLSAAAHAAALRSQLARMAAACGFSLAQEEAGGSHDTQLHAHMQQPCLGLGPHERLHVPCCGSGGNGELTGDAGGFMIGHVGSAYLQGGVCMHTVQQELDLGRQPEAFSESDVLALLPANCSHLLAGQTVLARLVRLSAASQCASPAASPQQGVASAAAQQIGRTAIVRLPGGTHGAEALLTQQLDLACVLLRRLSQQPAAGFVAADDPHIQAALYAHGDIQQLHTCLHALTAPHPSSLMMRVTLQHVDLAVLCALCHDEQLSACLEHQQPLQAAAAAWQPRAAAGEATRQVAAVLQALQQGWGNSTLGRHLHMSSSAAFSLRNSFLKRFPAISAHQNEVWEGCQKLGYVQTLAGRRRYYPGIATMSPKECKHAQRASFAAVLTGSAADVTKAALLRISQAVIASASAHLLASQLQGCLVVRAAHVWQQGVVFEVAGTGIEQVLRLFEGVCVSGLGMVSLPSGAKPAATVSVQWGRSLHPLACSQLTLSCGL